MENIRGKIEILFESFGHTIYRHRWKTIIPILTITLLLGLQLPKLKVDTSTESFLHKDDPTILEYNDFRREFGRDEFIIVAIESPDIFSINFLNKLKSLHNELEDNLPYIDDIISLINARNTRGEGDQLIVEDLLESFPQNTDDLETLKQRVMTNRFYINRLISEDGRFTAIAIKTDTYSSMGEKIDVLEGFDDYGSDEELLNFDSEYTDNNSSDLFLTDEENSEIVRSAIDIIKKYKSPDFKIYLAGSPVIFDAIKRNMLSDMAIFMRLALLTITICLYLMFRRISGVIFPIIIVAFSLISTLGIMAFFGVPITLPMNILPSFILSVGVGAAVHILAIFYQNYQKSGDREDAICKAMGHSGLAVLMTSLTTAAGLVSFATAEIAPIGHLGIFAGIGVLIALVNTLILLPALISITHIRIKKQKREKGGDLFMHNLLISVADFSTGHAKSIVAISFILIILSIAGALKLSFSHNPLIWLSDKQPIRIATEKIDREMKGSITLDVVVDTGRENGLYDLLTLNRLEALAEELEKFEAGDIFVGKTTSLVDILKEIHQALNENRPEYYMVPQNPNLIPQEFLLFENSGSDDLEDVVDTRFSKARFTIKAPWSDAVKFLPFLLEIEERFEEVFGDDAEITATGLVPMMVRTFYAAIHSMAKSYIIAFVVITIMMIILIGNIRLGLLSMIPNLLPVIITMGVIGWFGFLFDMFTMLIGSIAIGLAVDDTVHFMHNFQRYYGETKNVRDSVRLTLTTAGRAMLVTSIVLSIGFFIFMFASMRNLYNFGFLTGVTIISALLADYFLAPAIMVMIKEKNKRR